MDVSIILVNFNTKDLTLNCIKSVYEQTSGIEFEIYVVDNNSQDDSCKAIENEFPNVKIIRNADNKGFGVANNIAVRDSEAKYVFCLNTDTLLINNAIFEMYKFMEENENTGAVGGNLYHKDMSPAFSFYYYFNIWNSSLFYWFAKKLFKNKFAAKELKDVTDVDFISGADLFMRKSVLDKVGLFDENIFMYYEDMDLCKRIKDCGFGVKIIPAAKIYHLEGSSCKNFLKRTQLSMKGKYYYIRKHNSKLCLYCMKIPYIILHLLCYLFTFNKEHLNLLKIHING